MEYNSQILEIKKDSIVLESGEVVMMQWEFPLMKRHAEICTKENGVILEVGFGMGISANYIQELKPKTHVIVESHSQIITLLKEWSIDKPSVVIIEGDWFDKINEIINYQYDGIFFDTHRDINIPRFKSLVVDNCLKTGGVFTWFEPSGANTFECQYKTETIQVNPINCNYWFENTTKCPYYIKV